MQANKVEEQWLSNTAIRSYKACKRNSFKEKPIIKPLQIQHIINIEQNKI